MVGCLVGSGNREICSLPDLEDAAEGGVKVVERQVGSGNRKICSLPDLEDATEGGVEEVG